MKNQIRHSHFLSLLLRVGLIVALLVCGWPVAPVRAASTLTVNNNADSGAGSLRQAIADAAAGDTINFDSSLSGATITLASQLVLSKNVTIDGSALTVPITISGNDAVRVFYINSGVSAELNSLKVTNGRPTGSGGGGIYNNNGTLTITNSTITGNSAPSYTGGGIYSSGTLTLTNSTCSFNSTASGGCLNGSGVITITNSAISDNFAGYNGGGIMLSGMLTMTNSAVIGNSAVNEGGGINISGTTATITNSTIANNTARLVGGGIRAGSNSTIIKDCTFSGNSSGDRGGGIYKGITGTFAITNSTFMNNVAYYGGAIASPVGTNLTVTNATFVNNMSSSGGDNFIANINQEFSLANSIVYNGGCSNENGQPAIIDGGNNLDNGTDCGFSSSTKGSLSNTNPRLGALTGSPAYYPLQAGSPAINGVTYNAPNACPATDQRGVARPQGGACDIGAYEYYIPAPEIDVLGNGLSILSGSATPSTANGTDFGPVTPAASVSQTFTLQNTGVVALTLSGAPLVQISGANAADFSVSLQPTSPVDVAGSTTFTVSFSPSALGLRQATLSIANNDSDENPYTFNIQGTGTPTPEMDIKGNSVSIVDGDTTPDAADHTDFGSVDITAGTMDRTFTIYNTGAADLTLSGSPKVVISGANAADFSVTADPTSPVAATSGSATFTVHFAPSATGVRSATLSIANNDSDENPYNFDIQGTGAVNNPPTAATNLSPNVDIGTNYNPTYQWDKVPAASYYRLYVSGLSGVVIDQWYESSSICDAIICSVMTSPSATLAGGAYSWYVQTYNPIGYGLWTARTDFTTTIPSAPAAATSLTPGAVNPATPTDIGTNYTPTYSWDKITGATYYRLYVSGPGGVVLDQWYPSASTCPMAVCSVISPTLGGGTYSWYVQTYGPAGYGPWSNTTDGVTHPARFSTSTTPPVAADLLTPGTVNPATPTDIGTNYTPTYSWSKIPEATYYRLYVSGPSGVVLDQWYPAASICPTSTCSIVSPTLGGGVYSWYVQTYSPAGYGPWSNTVNGVIQPMRFSTSMALPAAATSLAPGAVNPAIPTDIGTDYTPTYNWSKIPEATYYRLYVSGPSGVVLDQWYPAASICPSTCSVTSPTLGGGVYSWYVQTYGPAGYGPWSNTTDGVIQPMRFSTSTTPPAAATSLTPGTVNPATPRDIGTNYTPTYSWSKIPAATYYRLYVSGPSGVVLDQWYQAASICPVTTCSVASPILGSGTYSWYVQTYGPAGYGPWSNTMSGVVQPMRFSTTTPTAPAGATLTLPTPGATTANHTPTYTWTKVDMATWYRLYVKGPGGVLVKDQWYASSSVCVGSTCTIVSPALESGFHTWWIQTYNVAGYGPWKSATFTVSP